MPVRRWSWRSKAVQPNATERRSARWVAALLVLVILTQRLGIPGVPFIGMTTVLILGWVAVAAVCHVITLDRLRFSWWLAMGGVTGIAMLLQQAWVSGSEISVNAWLLVLAVWLPFAFRLVDTGRAGFVLLLRYLTRTTVVLAVATLAMVGSQLAGVQYEDVMARFVPPSFLLEGFNTLIPIFYGSPIYKGTAWIGLEPSITSAFLGLGLLAALLSRSSIWAIVILIVGLVATVSGSGVVLVIGGVVVLLLSRARSVLAPYWFLGILTVVATSLTTFGEVLLSRSTEVQSDNSSAALRSTLPYEVITPQWISDPLAVLLGWGPGSSQRVVNDSGLVGLLVPTPVKIFYEYGLLAGLILAGMFLLAFWGGPSRTLSIPLLLTLLLLQPGLTTAIITVPVLALVTLWSPRRGPQMEDDPDGLAVPASDDIDEGTRPAPPGRIVARSAR